MDRIPTQAHITASTVRRGDIIVIGGKQLQVADLVTMPMGAKRLTFDTGETLTLHQHTELTAIRVLPPCPAEIYAARRATVRHSAPRRPAT